MRITFPSERNKKNKKNGTLSAGITRSPRLGNSKRNGNSENYRVRKKNRKNPGVAQSGPIGLWVGKQPRIFDKSHHFRRPPTTTTKLRHCMISIRSETRSSHIGTYCITYGTNRTERIRVRPSFRQIEGVHNEGVLGSFRKSTQFEKVAYRAFPYMYT